MRKKYFNTTSITIPIYGGKLVIIFTSDAIAVKKIIPSFEDEEVFAHAVYENWKGYEGYIMVLNFEHNKAITHGVIWHEIFHTVNFIAQTRGIDLDVENDEPLAYLGMWITDEVYKFINKQNIKI